MKYYTSKTKNKKQNTGSLIYEEVLFQKFTCWVCYIIFFYKYVISFPVHEMNLFNS